MSREPIVVMPRARSCIGVPCGFVDSIVSNSLWPSFAPNLVTRPWPNPTLKRTTGEFLAMIELFPRSSALPNRWAEILATFDIH